MWWTWDDYYLYALDLRLPGAPAEPIGLDIQPVKDLMQKSGS
jgi:hypothetical protein